MSSADAFHPKLREINLLLQEGGARDLRLPDLPILALALTGEKTASIDEVLALGVRLRMIGARETRDFPPAAFTSWGKVEMNRAGAYRLRRGLDLRDCLEAIIDRLLSLAHERLVHERSRAVTRRPAANGSKPPAAPGAKRVGAARGATGAGKKAAPPPKSVTARKKPAAHAPPAEAPIPPPPSMRSLAISWDPPSAEAIARILHRPFEGPEAWSHTLEAHALHSADRFEELLSLPTLRGVETHTYQTETVRKVLRQFRGRALLADEVGLGKTVEAIMILREYQLRGMARRVLILVPPALVGQWAGELSAKAGVEALVAGDIGEGGEFWRRDGVILASQALARLQRHAAVLLEQSWDLVVVDEAHHLKNRSTLLHKLVDGLRSRFFLALTATPVENDLEELYNLVTLLRPGHLETLGEFKKKYMDRKDPTAAKNTDRLKGLLGEVMVRNTRATCGLVLPPRYVSSVAVEPTPSEGRLYQGITDFFRRFREGSRRLLVDTLLLEAGSSPAAVKASLQRFDQGEPPEEIREGLADLRRLAGAVEVSARSWALLDLLKASQEKVLVFTRYRATLAHLEELAGLAGLESAVVHGGMPRAGKDEAIRRFREEVPLLLCTDVGSEGQNLQFCRTLVNFDLPWNPMLIEQRIGRLHRYGQKAEVRVYNFYNKGTVEERLLDVLDRRVHLFELVVGEMDMVLGNVVEQRDFEEWILDLYASSRSEEEVSGAFDALAEELARARGQYGRIQALDQSLFGQEYET